MLRLLLMTVLSGLPVMAGSDYTHTWWEEGYPYSTYKHWEEQRSPVVITQTSAYTMAWNTRTLQFPHFGALAQGVPYGEVGRDYSRPWTKLPAAQLELSYQIGEDVYTCVGAQAPDRKVDWHRGARMIESGRLYQRSDVWKLQFAAPNGEVAQKLARIEVGTWSQHLTLTFRMEEAEGEGTLSLRLTTAQQAHEVSAPLSAGQGMARLALVLAGDRFVAAPPEEQRDGIELQCKAAKFDYNNEFQAHRIHLFRVKGQPLPEGATANDQIWEIPFTIKNTDEVAKDARLLLDLETNRPFGQLTGEPITGVTMLLCDQDGRPTGHHVQHSKNWHVLPDEEVPYQFQWFRGLTKIPLQPGEERSLKIRVFHAQYGGISAASHAQLCLIGWGMNSLWEETALGAFGESFCYEPTRAHRDCMITDMRPLMVKSYDATKKYSWTHNMGGGDFLHFDRAGGKRLASHFARSTYHSHGPCLTDTVYHALLGDGEAKYEVQVGLARTNDLARTSYRIDLEVLKDVEVSRGVVFSIGADYYNSPSEGKVAYGDRSGVTAEWQVANKKRSSQRYALEGDTPWVSLHDVQRPPAYKQPGGIASRGMIIRSWSATLGGQQHPPYLHANVKKRGKYHHTQAELVLPPSITTLRKGDRITAELEFLLPPESAETYYGPNEAFRKQAAPTLNRWQSIHREATAHHQEVDVQAGQLVHQFPDIQLRAPEGKAEFTINGGQTRYNAITITGLPSPTTGTLRVDGQPLTQAIYGEDYYQTIFHPESKTYSKTYNVQFPDQKRYKVSFQ